MGKARSGPANLLTLLIPTKKKRMFLYMLHEFNKITWRSCNIMEHDGDDIKAQINADCRDILITAAIAHLMSYSTKHMTLRC